MIGDESEGRGGVTPKGTCLPILRADSRLEDSELPNKAITDSTRLWRIESYVTKGYAVEYPTESNNVLEHPAPLRPYRDFYSHRSQRNGPHPRAPVN